MNDLLQFYILTIEFRLRANEYDDLRGKLQAHIENVKNIVVRQSLSDLFVDDFRRYVLRNPKYRLPINQQVHIINHLSSQSDNIIFHFTFRI